MRSRISASSVRSSVATGPGRRSGGGGSGEAGGAAVVAAVSLALAGEGSARAGRSGRCSRPPAAAACAGGRGRPRGGRLRLAIGACGRRVHDLGRGGRGPPRRAWRSALPALFPMLAGVLGEAVADQDAGDGQLGDQGPGSRLGQLAALPERSEGLRLEEHLGRRHLVVVEVEVLERRSSGGWGCERGCSRRRGGR